MDNSDLIPYAKEVYKKAILDHDPKAVVLMLSGGDDSVAAYLATKELGIKLDGVIHGKTGTGIPETTKFVTELVNKHNDNLIISDAGDSYQKYVFRKGFFGFGRSAHNYAYRILKAGPFRTALSRNFRHKKRGFNILLINGGRRLESDNRKKTMKTPIRVDSAVKSNIWVNICNEWDNHQPVDYIEESREYRNPVSKKICRSGECWCGTMQTKADFNEAAYFYPKWAKHMNDIKNQVYKKHGSVWGSSDKGWIMEKKGQLPLFEPLCNDCSNIFEKTGGQDG